LSAGHITENMKTFFRLLPVLVVSVQQSEIWSFQTSPSSIPILSSSSRGSSSSSRLPFVATSEHHISDPGTGFGSMTSLSATVDADSTVSSSTSSTTTIPADWKEQVLFTLSSIIDPDLGTDIVTLGFIKNLTLDESSATVSFECELTTPACPIKEQFERDCHDLVSALPWVSQAEVELTAQPPQSSTEELGLTKVASIIAVSSCKGGVGKSTTAVNLAFSLKKLGARVGIFDADIYGPSLPTMVTPQDDMVRFTGRQIKPLERDGVKLMSFGYVNEGSAVMRGPMISQLLDQFLTVTNWGELDYLILDMPPGTGDIQLTLSQRLNITAAVIVTTPQELSFADVVRGVDMFDSVEVPCIAVVENMAYYELPRKQPQPAEKLDLDQLREAFMEKMQEQKINGDMAEDLASQLVDIVQAQKPTTPPPSSSEEKEQIRIFGPGHTQRLANQWGIEHTYSLPLMNDFAKCGDSGLPFVLANPESTQTKIYKNLAESVVSEVAKIKFKNESQKLTVEYDQANHVLNIYDGASDETTTNGEEEGEESIVTTSPSSLIKHQLPPAALRRECKCAACVEEMTGKQILVKSDVSDAVKPITMEPCGNYALSVNWSDGHRSLYPYRQIRALARGEEVIPRRGLFNK